MIFMKVSTTSKSVSKEVQFRFFSLKVILLFRQPVYQMAPFDIYVFWQFYAIQHHLL